MRWMVASLAIGMWGWTAWADTDQAPAPVEAKSNAAGEARPRPAAKQRRAVPPVTRRQEADVLEFVRKYHAELSEVLSHLEQGRSQSYARAIHDLDRTRKRLAQIEQSNPARFALELRRWQAESRAQLLAARLQMGDEALREELRAALAEAYDLRIQILQAERERLAKRRARLERQLTDLREARENALDRQFRQLTRPPAKKKKKRN